MIDIENTPSKQFPIIVFINREGRQFTEAAARELYRKLKDALNCIDDNKNGFKDE